MESKSEGRFTFQVIHAHLSKNEYPPSFSKEDKRSLRRRAKCFNAVDGELYYVGSARKTIGPMHGICYHLYRAKHNL